MSTIVNWDVNIKRVGKWVPFCCTIAVELVTIMIVLNRNSMIFRCIQKMILSGHNLMTYIGHDILIELLLK